MLGHAKVLHLGNMAEFAAVLVEVIIQEIARTEARASGEQQEREGKKRENGESSIASQ
jgi:hypothetical protein